MKFKYRVVWVNINKNRQEWVDINNQHIALFVAKQKISEGMQDVLIQITGEYGEDSEDES